MNLIEGAWLISAIYALLLFMVAMEFAKLRRSALSIGVSKSSLPKVTVMVAMRNESAHIEQLILDLKEQDYPFDLFNCILIDDHSEDDTVLKAQSVLNANQQVVVLPTGIEGKKAAIDYAAKQCTSPFMIQTDADCRLKRDWLRVMVAEALTQQADMVCGSVMVDRGTRFLSHFQAMETAVLQVTGLVSLAYGRPFLNTGASMLVRAEARSGYSMMAGRREASGDDVFMMMDLKRKGKLIYGSLNPSAMVSTLAEGNWTELRNQRVRRAAKLRSYSSPVIPLLGVGFLFTCLAIPVLLIATLLSPAAGVYLVSAILLRLMAEYSVLHQWSAFSQQRFPAVSIVLMSLLYPLFSLSIVPALIKGRAFWKGRKV